MMNRATGMMLGCVMLIVQAAGTQAAVELQYSGADWSSDPTSNGTMTISAVDGGTTLWELDILTSGGGSAYTSFSRFTDGGSFNYASGMGNYRGPGLMKVGDSSNENRGQLHQIAKTADAYVFSLTNALDANWLATVTYTISKPNTEGTRISAQYVLERLTTPGDEAWQSMGFRSGLNIGSNDTGSFDYVTGYELAAGDPEVHVDRMHQRTSDSAAGLYQVTENMDSGVGATNSNLTAGWTATVLDNANTDAAGMTADLEFAYSSDLYPYYGGSLGTFGVVDSASYYDALQMYYNPRQWQDNAPNPYPIMEQGETYTSNFALDVNIAAVPEPMTMSLLAAGGLMMLKRRRR